MKIFFLLISIMTCLLNFTLTKTLQNEEENELVLYDEYSFEIKSTTKLDSTIMLQNVFKNESHQSIMPVYFISLVIIFYVFIN